MSNEHLVELECSCLKGTNATCSSGGELLAEMTINSRFTASVESESSVTSPGADAFCIDTISSVTGAGPFYTVELNGCDCNGVSDTWVAEISANSQTYYYTISSINGCFVDILYWYSTDAVDRQVLVGDEIRLVGSLPDTSPNLILAKEINATLEFVSSLDSRLSSLFPFDVEISAEVEIEEQITVNYSLSQDLVTSGNFDVSYADKISGDFGDFYCNDKLYPDADLALDSGFASFSGPSGQTSQIYQYIDEGVYEGLLQDRADSVTLSDENTFIVPSSINTEGFFQYKCELTSLSARPDQSAFRMRVAAPLQTYEASIPPLYTVYNIRLLDPSGNLVIKYNDIQMRGDGYYATYSSLPEINVLNEYDWDRRTQPHLHEQLGYQLSFNVRAVSLDDPFSPGFNEGFEENYILPETYSVSGNVYLALDDSLLASEEQKFINPSPWFKVSAVEICNSGGLGPRSEDFLPAYVEVREKGIRLERCITPRFMPLYDFDTTIYPSLSTVWDGGSSSNEDECGARELVDILNQKNDLRFITSRDSVSDSGKLVLKFGGCSSNVDEITNGDFNFEFDQSSNNRWWSPSGAFNTENRRERIHRNDELFYNVDTVTLKVLAKKEVGTRDYILDVVGYSDDKLLNQTSASGGFLQNPSGVHLNDIVVASTGQYPVVSGFYGENDWALGGSALSERDDYFEASGNDHYKLTPYPVVTGTTFEWYEVPLEILDDQVRLGTSRDYSVSSLLENIYLDIYPLPSGASIAYAELCVRYAPSNGLNFYTQGGESLGKVQDGRSESALFPTAMGSGEDILNAGSGYAPLSRLEGLPHLYGSPDTLKTNYSRRWRGVEGTVRGPYDPNEFGFGFENPVVDYPFLSGYYKLDNVDGLYLQSSSLGPATPSGLGTMSGVFAASPEIYHNIGWRYSSGTLFPGYSGNYKTSDWTALSNGATSFVGNPLYGKIADAFDRTVRISQDTQNVNFGNLSAASGFSVFARFTPDINVSGVGYDQFQSGVIFSKWDVASELDFALAYSGGYLCGYAKDNDGNIITVADTIPYSGYQFPLNVILTYNDNQSSGLKLYADNEFVYPHNVLRASSAPFHKVDTNADLVLGWSAGSGVGMNMLVSEFGVSSWGSGGLYGSGTNIVESDADWTHKQVTAEKFLENSRVKFFDPDEPYTNDRYKLWDRVNEDTYSDWALGDFQHCSFDSAFSQWQKRPNTEQIVFDISHHGSGYSESNDLPMPWQVDSGVSYHTQIENDFLRFYLSDVQDSFYSVNRRITKNLPCGYKFSEDALVVETVLDHSTGHGIEWSSCEDIAPSGPRLVVSLYTKKQEPYWTPDEDNWGLVNRKIHYLMPSSCIMRLDSTFTYDDICDTTEAWAIFPEEPRIKDFSERYFSDDINDMFVQYDLVYPSGPAFESKIILHSSHVRMADANIYRTLKDNTIGLYASGAFPADSELTLNVGGFAQEYNDTIPLQMNVPLPHSVFDDSPDGFVLNVSGAFTENSTLLLYMPPQSGSEYFNLTISGEVPSNLSGVVNLSMPNTFGRFDSSDDNDTISSIGGSGSFFGMPLTMFNSQISLKSEGPVLTLNTFATSGNGAVGYVPLTLWNSFKNISTGSASGDVTLNMRGGSGGEQRRYFGSMPLHIKAPQIVNADVPLYLHNPAESASLTNSVNLVTANFSSSFGSAYGLWFNNNYGTGIELEEDYLAAIPVSNEIRGVDLTAYGSCTGDSPSKAVDKVLETDCTIWREAVCNDGGIFRAKDTYTNSGAINFGGGFGYSGNYYGIRKYDSLIPSIAYDTTLTVKTGSTDPISVPPTFEDWEYGMCGPSWDADGCCVEDCDQDLVYSGVKLIADDTDLAMLIASGRKPGNKYGSTVSVNGNLMAIASPKMSIPEFDAYRLDASGLADPGMVDVSGAGAVFLYRRGKDVPGKKADWNLIEPLMLPTGFRKDYIQRVQENLLTFDNYSISGNKWQIGQEGREFGSSLDMAVSGDREVVVVGAPRAKWTRDFADIQTSGIPTAAMVFADLFTYNKSEISSVASAASRFNILWKYFSAPWNAGPSEWYAEINPKIIVLQLTYSNKEYPVIPTDESDWFVHRYIPRLDDIDLIENIGSGLLGGSGTLSDWITVARPVIFNEMRSGVLDAFFESFPSSRPVLYSGVPAIMGMFKEETGSTAGALRYANASGDVVSIYDDFEEFYLDYSSQSGVFDPTTGLAQSGHLNTIVGQSENWATTATELLYNTFDSGRLSSTFTGTTLNRDFITSGVGQEWGDTHSNILQQFQVPPASGGRVYIFEKERDNFNCIQVVTSPNDVAEFESDNEDTLGATYGKTYNDRFGHSVAISNNGEIMSIGSPWNYVSCRVFERDETQNQRVYDNVRSWCSSKSKTAATAYYDSVVATSGAAVAKTATYDYLSPSERFEFRNDIGFWGTLPTPYIPSYTYGYGDIQYVGTRQFLPGTFAGTSRLGWSTAVNEEGDIVAFGAPTDSFNEFEDANVWGDGELSWASYVNAGAVRMFESRKYYPHSGVVEFGRFGNLDRSFHEEEREAGYYDNMGQVFASGSDGSASYTSKYWRRTEFSEIELPQDAGLAFIMTPELDAASDEIIDNIKNWLALGDRNLVIVGNDPVWEENGLYAESNDIVNKVLEKLGSRMKIFPARDISYSMQGCIDQEDINSNKYNVTKSKTPAYSTGASIGQGNYYANGVGDIRINLQKDRLAEYLEYMDCPEGASCDDSEGQVVNVRCEFPLGHEGDLRAEWTEQCTKSTPRGCTVISYKKNWPLQFNNYVPGCDTPPDPMFLRKNQEPVPVLTTAEHLPPVPWYQPATSGLICDYTRTYETYYEINQAGSTVTEFAEDNVDYLAFNIANDEDANISGIFSSFVYDGDFIDPAPLNGRDGLLQGVGRSFYPEHEERTETRVIYPESILGLVESGRMDDGQHNNSRVYLMATQWSEDDASRGIDDSTTNDDKNTEFYINMVRRGCVSAPRGMQINGFTGRTSLENAYYLKDESSTDGHGLGGKLNVEFSPGGGSFVENREVSDINDLTDFVWIAHPSGKPSAQDLQDIKSWLNLGNKKLIITYNAAAGSTRQEIASNVDYLCSGLNVTSRPFFVPSVGEYWVTDSIISSYEGNASAQRVNVRTDSVSGCDDGYSFTFPNYQESTALSGLHFSSSTERTSDDPVDDYEFDKKKFIPLSGGLDYQKIVWWTDDITEQYTVYPSNRLKIDGSASIEFPAEVGSGYRIFVNWVSEKTSEKFNICGDIEGVTFGPTDESGSEGFLGGGAESPCDTPIDLSKTTSLVPSQSVFDVRATGDSIKINLNTGPWSSFISEGEIIDGVLPVTPRFVSISGCPLPINTETVITTTSGIKRRLVDIVEDCRYEVNPAMSGVLPGVSRPVMHLSELYCDPAGMEPQCSSLGNVLIEDGPVVAAEEFESFSAFQAGRRRSKIIVVSDSTLLQGQCPEHRATTITGNQEFIRSLYPPSPNELSSYGDGLDSDMFNADLGSSESTVNGRNWFFSQKLRAPERGSAAKYVAISGSAVNNITSPLYGGVGVVGSLENYTDAEDTFDPATVSRPEELKGDEVRQRIDNFYNSDALSGYGIFPRFSGDFLNIASGQYYNELLGEPLPIIKDQKGFIADAKIGGGLNDLMRINNTDYLDLDVYYSGCLGDLFGYSIDLSQNKLVVGTPFNAYYTEGAASGVSGIVQWHEVQNDPTLSAVRIAEDGGAGAVFVYERTGSGQNIVSEFLPWQFAKKIKPTSLNVGITDFSLGAVDALTAQRGPHSIADSGFILEFARRSDNFGASVAIDCDMVAAGAPNHDFETLHHHIYSGVIDPNGLNSAFQRKSFNPEYDIPQHVYFDLGESGVRVDQYGNASGTMVLNNGAVFTYRNEMVDFQARDKDWIYAEKLYAQGYLDRTSGTENDRFGQAVSINRARRGDADYTLVAGSPRHDWPTSGNHPTSGVTDAGSAYTFDAMLRGQTPSIPNGEGWIDVNVFSQPVDKLGTRVYQNASGDSETYTVSGILFSNRDGEIFLEVSGFDSSEKGFIGHRPYVDSVDFKLYPPNTTSDSFNLFASGMEVDESGKLNLTLVGPDQANVYNTVNLYQFGTSGFSSGTMPLFTEAPSGHSGTLNLNLASTQTTGQLDLRIRGY